MGPKRRGEASVVAGGGGGGGGVGGGVGGGASGAGTTGRSGIGQQTRSRERRKTSSKLRVGDEEEVKLRRLARLDRLELTNAWDKVDEVVGGNPDDDDDLDYAESEASDPDKPHKRARSSAAAASGAPSARKGKKKSAAGGNLGTVGGAAMGFLAANRPALSLVEAIMSDEPDSSNTLQLDWVSAAAAPSLYPAPPVCDATGKVGRYRDPATGLRFYDRRALAMLAEAQPAWCRGLAVAPYWEAVAQVKADRAKPSR